MDLKEGKQKFIETWGKLAGSWGITRTMAQIHALLLLESGALSTENIMEELQISRGNANMNLRELMEWGLITKACRDGCRKDYFHAEKDIWHVFRMIAIQRKKRELEPVIRALDQLLEVEGSCPNSELFKGMVRDIRQFSSRVDVLLEKVTRKESEWLLNGIAKIAR